MIQHLPLFDVLLTLSDLKEGLVTKKELRLKNAIAFFNNCFQKELIQAEKDLAGKPELLLDKIPQFNVFQDLEPKV